MANIFEDYKERMRTYELRMSDAVRQILEVSTRLHLTWNEFEEVLRRIKNRAYICSEPVSSKEDDEVIHEVPKEVSRTGILEIYRHYGYQQDEAK